MTGLIGKYMRKHALENNIWDEGQLGAVEDVLGTVDQLIIDNCIMEEVKTYHRNLAADFSITRKPMTKCTMIGWCECMSGLAYQQQSFHY